MAMRKDTNGSCSTGEAPLLLAADDEDDEAEVAVDAASDPDAEWEAEVLFAVLVEFEVAV
jgi:hypothetical protein